MVTTRAIVLAAGKSTRIASISRDLPKPLLPIGGEAVLSRNLRWLARQGVERCWINLHHRGEQITAEIGEGSGRGLQITYVTEREILGTAGAVRNIAADWEEPVLVVYGDNLMSVDLESMERAHITSGAAVTIGLFDRITDPHTGIAGGTVAIDSTGRIVGFHEGALAAESNLVNAGIYFVEPRVISELPGGFCDFARDVFPKLIETGVMLKGHKIGGYCLGIDTPEAYGRAVEMVAKGEVALQ